MLDQKPLQLLTSAALAIVFAMPAAAQQSAPISETADTIETITPKKRIRVIEPVSYWVDANRLRIRDNPFAGDVVGMLEMGQKIKAYENVDGWVRISGQGKDNKWINSRFLSSSQITWSNYGYSSRGSRSLADAPYDITLKRIKIKGVKDVKVYAADIKSIDDHKRIIMTRHEFRSGPYYERRLVQCGEDQIASHVKVLGEGYTFDMMNADPRNAAAQKPMDASSAIDSETTSALNKTIADFTCETDSF